MSSLGEIMLDITTVSAVVASAGVIVGVAFALLELRNLVETRQTDLVIRLYSAFGSKEMRDTWERVVDRDENDFNTYKTKFGMSDVNEIGWFYEGLGVLLHRKLVDIAVVDDLFSSPIKTSWEKLEPIAEGERKYYNRPQVWEWWEYLYNQMQQREHKLAPKTT